MCFLFFFCCRKRLKIKYSASTHLQYWLGHLASQNVYRRYKFCAEGPDYVNGDARMSLIYENYEAVTQNFIENHRIPIGEVAEDIALPVSSCYEIFSDILKKPRPKKQVRFKFDDFVCKIDCCFSTIVDEVTLMYTNERFRKYFTLCYSRKKNYIRLIATRFTSNNCCYHFQGVFSISC